VGDSSLEVTPGADNSYLYVALLDYLDQSAKVPIAEIIKRKAMQSKVLTSSKFEKLTL
jgi:hypothetical protein